MNIHEYQAKKLFQGFDLEILKGKMVTSVGEAIAAAQEMGGQAWVVKAQIHAGGRGKGGGVKVARSLDEVRAFSQEILGMNLVTHQTGPEGKKVYKIYNVNNKLKSFIYRGLKRNKIN